MSARPPRSTQDHYRKTIAKLSAAAEGNANAAERRDLNKRINHELLYDRIKGGKCLTRLELVEKQLLINKNGQRKLDGDDIRRLSVVADIQFKKLAKILPDRTRVDSVVAHIKPDRDTLIAEAQALGLPLEWVFGERGTTVDQPADPESD